MRNRFPGKCYRCGCRVDVGAGHFEKLCSGGWRVQHASCAIKYRGTSVGNEQRDADRARYAAIAGRASAATPSDFEDLTA